MLLRRILAVAEGAPDESGAAPGRPNVANVIVVVMPVAVGNSPTIHAWARRHGRPGIRHAKRLLHK
jgi:hypothetical protein